MIEEREAVVCPHCRAGVTVIEGADRYSWHEELYAPGKQCFMSGLPRPFRGTSEVDMKRRAAVVASLALMVQEEDPAVVWAYLKAVPADFVRELAQVAFAALNVGDRTVEQIWSGWAVDAQ